MPMGDRIGHAELQIGNSRIMLADEAPQMDAYGPKHHNGSPVSLMLYVDDVDTFTKKAVAAGAEVLRPVKNQFYGDRSGTFLDPFGYKWTIGTHVEDVSPEEMETRMASATAGQSSCTEVERMDLTPALWSGQPELTTNGALRGNC